MLFYTSEYSKILVFYLSVIKLFGLIVRVAGEIDSKAFEDRIVDLRENNGRMSLATAELLKLAHGVL